MEKDSKGTKEKRGKGRKKEKDIIDISMFSKTSKSSFSKRFTYTDLTSPVKLLLESKPTKINSLVKLSYTKHARGQRSPVEPWRRYGLQLSVFFSVISKYVCVLQWEKKTIKCL